MVVYLKNLLTILNFIVLFFVSKAHAASGPLAKGFGADDWIDKIHVLLTVLGIVICMTAILVFFILRKKDK